MSLLYRTPDLDNIEVHQILKPINSVMYQTKVYHYFTLTIYIHF